MPLQVVITRGIMTPNLDMSVFPRGGPARAAILERGVRGASFHLSRLLSATEDFDLPTKSDPIERSLDSSGMIQMVMLARKVWPQPYSYPHPLEGHCDTLQAVATENLFGLFMIYRGKLILPTIDEIDENQGYPDHIPRDVPSLILCDQDWIDFEPMSQHAQIARFAELEDEMTVLRRHFAPFGLLPDTPVLIGQVS